MCDHAHCVNKECKEYITQIDPFPIIRLIAVCVKYQNYMI